MDGSLILLQVYVVIALQGIFSKCLCLCDAVLSTTVTYDPEERTLNGTAVHCHEKFDTGEATKPYLVEIYKYPWNIGEDSIIKLVFIKEYVPDIAIMREGEKLPYCESYSGTSDNDIPKWLNSEDNEKVVQHLKTHCFVKVVYDNNHDNIPFKCIYRIEVVQNHSISGHVEFKYGLKKYAFVLPRSDRYLVFNDAGDLNKICTVISAVKGFGQTGLWYQSSLKDILSQLG